MATGSSSDQHTSPLCLELGASLPLAHLCYLPLDSIAGGAVNELDDVDNAGGRTAEERYLKPCCQAQDGRPTTLRQLQSSGHVGRVQTMENQTILPGFLLR